MNSMHYIIGINTQLIVSYITFSRRTLPRVSADRRFDWTTRTPETSLKAFS